MKLYTEENFNKDLAKRTKGMNPEEQEAYTNFAKQHYQSSGKDWRRNADLAYGQFKRDSNQNFGDKQAEINELSTDNSPEAQERTETLKQQQTDIVNNLTPEQKQDLQNDINNGNIPNAGEQSQEFNQSPGLENPQPESVSKTEQEVIAEKSQEPEIQEQSKSTAAGRMAKAFGISEDDAQAYLDAFIKGKMPPGSKGYFIGNAIATAAQNIANQLAASEYNNRWSSIRSGAHMDPEMQKSAWQEYKAANLNKLQDIQSKMAGEELVESEKEGNKSRKLQNEVLNYEAIMKNIDALGYQERQDLEMQMKRAGLDQQKLANEILKLNKMNEEERSKYFAEKAEMEAETLRATLNSLKYGGANLQVKSPFASGTIGLDTIANMGGDLKAFLKKARMK